MHDCVSCALEMVYGARKYAHLNYLAILTPDFVCQLRRYSAVHVCIERCVLIEYFCRRNHII